MEPWAELLRLDWFRRQPLADQAQALKPVFLAAIVPVGVFSRRPPRDSPAKLAALLPVWLCSCSHQLLPAHSRAGTSS